MVKLGVISDSHHSRIWLEGYLEVVRRGGYEAIFHLGDLYSDACWLKKQLTIPLISVVGNCDFFSDGDSEAVSTFEGHRILAVHGHLQDVKWGLDSLSYHAEELLADIALFGHTHRAQACYTGPVLTINPGALQQGDYCDLIIDGADIRPCLRNLKEGLKS